jgi:hypothetical protein
MSADKQELHPQRTLCYHFKSSHDALANHVKEGDIRFDTPLEFEVEHCIAERPVTAQNTKNLTTLTSTSHIVTHFNIRCSLYSAVSALKTSLPPALSDEISYLLCTCQAMSLRAAMANGVSRYEHLYDMFSNELQERLV